MKEQPIGKKKIIYNLSIIHRDIEKIMYAMNSSTYYKVKNISITFCNRN